MIGLTKTSCRRFWRTAGATAQGPARPPNADRSQQPRRKAGPDKIATENSGGNADSFTSTYDYINDALFGKRTAADGVTGVSKAARASAATTIRGGHASSQRQQLLTKRPAADITVEQGPPSCLAGVATAVDTGSASRRQADVVAEDARVPSAAVASVSSKAALNVTTPRRAACRPGSAGPVRSAVVDSVTRSSSGDSAAAAAAATMENGSESSSSRCLGAASDGTASPASSEQLAAAAATVQTAAAMPHSQRRDDEQMKQLLTYPLAPSPNHPVQGLLAVSLRQLADLSQGALPSVSKVLEDTKSPEDKQRLDDWKAKMIAKLGYDSFQQQQQATLRSGAVLHRNIERWLDEGGDRGQIETVKEEDAGHWSSLMSSGVLKELSPVVSLERRMEHDQLRYKGVVDCIASYRGIPSVIEWKTSKKPKQSLSAAYDHPLQLAAYMGIWNRLLQSQPHLMQAQQLSPVLQGVLVVAYESGACADVLVMQGNRCSYYWYEWLSRLHAFWTRRL